MWKLVAPPIVWATHFLLAYIFASVWCAKHGGQLLPARIAIFVITAAALGAFAVIGRRRKDDFIGYVALLLCALGAVGVIYGAIVAVMIRTCT